MKAVWWTYRQAVDDLKWNRWSKASTEVVTKLIGMELFIEEQENMVAPSSLCRSVSIFLNNVYQLEWDIYQLEWDKLDGEEYKANVLVQRGGKKKKL